ncbi:DUF1493 family protein [Serratia sp. C2(1)]|nr:DUF1493 family protein [Serratia sp. C2(2)]MEE4448246.1 DUF1493 family protein [Serratia sp. C2(1)]
MSDSEHPILRLQPASFLGSQPAQQEGSSPEPLKKPLTVRMFAESAKAGGWLY